MISGIAIVGGNGSGKTTLGKALAELLGYKHMDNEDYYFVDSTVPYAKSRTKEEVMELVLADMQKHPKFVWTSVNGDMGPEINALIDCIVYIQAPLDVRIERVKQRAVEKFGERVMEGGDMYEQEQKFFRFVADRSLDAVDAWTQSMNCPVIYVDGERPIAENLLKIKENLDKLQKTR